MPFMLALFVCSNQFELGKLVKVISTCWGSYFCKYAINTIALCVKEKPGLKLRAQQRQPTTQVDP
jgi:hypothetical protein